MSDPGPGRSLARASTATALAMLTFAAPAAFAAKGEQTRLRVTDANPRKTFFDSGRKARFDFELAGNKSRTVIVKAIKLSSGKVKRRWKLKDVPPKQTQRVRWNGKIVNGGFTNRGKHAFRVYERDGAKADMSDAKGKKRFRYHKNIFPIRARHTYGDGYGAGRGHRGQDVFARCGKKVRAVRGGRVQVRASHSAAGKYIVIDGRRTRRDYVYMHLKKRGRPKEGDRVRTGEKIGHVGATGNASGCHLHFEMWSGPGWYEGGRAMRPTKPLKKWDSWS